MECDSCTQLGWTAAGLSETPGERFSLDFSTGRMSLLVWFAFLFCLLIMCLFLHSTCFGVAFFSIHCLSLDCREDFQNAKVKSWSRFVLSSILSLSNVSEYFQFFCTSHAPRFSCNCDKLDDLILLKMSYVG